MTVPKKFQPKMTGGIPANVGFPSNMNSNQLPERLEDMQQTEYKSFLANQETE